VCRSHAVSLSVDDPHAHGVPNDGDGTTLASCPANTRPRSPRWSCLGPTPTTAGPRSLSWPWRTPTTRTARSRTARPRSPTCRCLAARSAARTHVGLLPRCWTPSPVQTLTRRSSHDRATIRPREGHGSAPSAPAPRITLRQGRDRMRVTDSTPPVTSRRLASALSSPPPPYRKSGVAPKRSSQYKAS